MGQSSGLAVVVAAAGCLCALTISARLADGFQGGAAACFEVGAPLRGVGPQCVSQGLGDGQVAEPLVVGRHDVPGGGLGGAAREGFLIGGGVGVPGTSLDPVGGGELPGLVAILLAGA